MARRVKSVEYWWNQLNTLPDAVDTAFPTLTVYLPEAATGAGITLLKVALDVFAHDAYTTATNVTQRQVSVTLQGASASTLNDTNTLTQSAENFSFGFTYDYTTYFSTNWGTALSRTVDLSAQFNTSAAGCVNVTARLLLTYEYDDTASTHVKTVWIPLDAPATALPSTQPGAANAGTFPALGTYLPEADVTVRQSMIVIQGNVESNSTVDRGIECRVTDGTTTVGTLTSALLELGSTSDYWYRMCFPVTSPDPAVEYQVRLWGTSASMAHPQVYAVVTYEFTPSSTTRVLQSVWLPQTLPGAFGGTGSGDAQTVEIPIMVQEPGTISTLRVAAFVYYCTLAPILALYSRLGTGSWIQYTSTTTNAFGTCGFMVRNDTAVTLARGENLLQLSTYRTDTSDLGAGTSACVLVNYTSDKATAGVGAHARTIWFPKRLSAMTSAVNQVIAAINPLALGADETSYALTNFGVCLQVQTNGTGATGGYFVGAFRVGPEGVPQYHSFNEWFSAADPEVGYFIFYAHDTTLFQRWTGDTADARMEALTTSRRWIMQSGGAVTNFFTLYNVYTYHTITYTVSGTVEGSAGGTVTLTLCNAVTHEPLLQTSRVGDGAYTFTWFDNTQEVYVVARESDTLVGRSANGYAV